MEGAREKWEASYERFRGWNTPKQRTVQELEAKLIVKWLIQQKLPCYDILEIGCGNGYLGKIIAEEFLQGNVPFSYHFTDLLERCVEDARMTLHDFPKQDALSFSRLNVYEADKRIAPESQSIIISTGFVSAATYRDAVPVVSQLLKQEGILISDFVNHFSPLVFLSRPLHSFKMLVHYISGNKGAGYHFGSLGLRQHFAQYGLLAKRCSALRLRCNPLLCMFQKRHLTSE